MAAPRPSLEPEASEVDYRLISRPDDDGRRRRGLRDIARRIRRVRAGPGPPPGRVEVPGPVPHRVEIPGGVPVVSSDRFRQVMTAFPAAVTVVTALDAEGKPRGLTCSTSCSLSMDPPMMLVCVNRRNHSLEAIRASSGFTVNLLRVDSGPISALFASPSPDKFSLLSWRPSPVSGLPWLYADALAFVDCRLVADVAAASHAILIGLVTDVHSDISENGQQAGGPLVYWRRHYGGWSAPAFSIGPGQD